MLFTVKYPLNFFFLGAACFLLSQASVLRQLMQLGFHYLIHL